MNAAGLRRCIQEKEAMATAYNDLSAHSAKLERECSLYERDLERAMESCDDLARENDQLRARLNDNADVERAVSVLDKMSIAGPGCYQNNGKCPLTPLEVGLMLRGMGFSNNTAIYLASGRIYKAEKNMAPLLEKFPLLQTKETLASDEELAPFKNFSSRMAAIDYSVCVHSEVFVQMEVIETLVAQYEGTQ